MEGTTFLHSFESLVTLHGSGLGTSLRPFTVTRLVTHFFAHNFLLLVLNQIFFPESLFGFGFFSLKHFQFAFLPCSNDRHLLLLESFHYFDYFHRFHYFDYFHRFHWTGSHWNRH